MKIARHSPSALNLFCASPSMFVLERILGHKQPVGSPAHRGTAVEAGVTYGLQRPSTTLQDCAAVAHLKYLEVSALSGDPRREDYAKTITVMVERALEELRPYGIPDDTQGFVEWHPDDLKYPIVGYYDFAWYERGLIIDLKTTDRMPKEIKPAHARQVAFYCSSNNMAGHLTYITPKLRTTYRLENIDEHRNALHQIARRCEAFLELSDDPEFFVSITAPDTESFYWQPPAARAQAFQVWRI